MGSFCIKSRLQILLSSLAQTVSPWGTAMWATAFPPQIDPILPQQHSSPFKVAVVKILWGFSLGFRAESLRSGWLGGLDSNPHL